MDKTSFYLLLSSFVSSALGARGNEGACGHDVVLARSERGRTGHSVRSRIEVSGGVMRELALRMRHGAPEKQPIAGRRPAGLLAARRREASGVADYLARAAHLEAASVFAFDNLAEDLASVGAPSALVEQSLLAARQERVHARVMGRLARARGAAPPAIDVMLRGRSSLLDLARENMVEGVVRESYGALQASFSGRTAGDPEVRAAMAAIAVDEAAHAWLGQQIADWIEPQLGEGERAEVVRAKVDAIRALRAELSEEPSLALRRELGVPSRAQALRLFDGLAQRVWRVAA